MHDLLNRFFGNLTAYLWGVFLATRLAGIHEMPWWWAFALLPGVWFVMIDNGLAKRLRDRRGGAA